MSTKLIQTQDYLLLIDEEAEIKEGSKWVYDNDKPSIIPLLGNTNIVKEGISKGWFNKIIAYRKLNEEVKELDLPLLPPFEKVDVNIQTRNFNKQVKNPYLTEEKEYQVWEEAYIKGFDDGLAQSKQFSLEDMKKAIEMAREQSMIGTQLSDGLEFDYTEEEIIQSLSNQQLPKEFIPEYEREHDDTVPFPKMRDSKKIKTIINSEGKEEMVGKYR